ncbi:MAG: replication-relaxation family protein [Fimbriimonas sp.]
MRLTARDVRLLRDVALSHVLSRDQMIALRYFGSVTRANTRTRSLVALRFLKRLDTPFFGQGLYSAGPEAAEVLGPSIAPLVRGRADSPRFVQHALAVTNARIELLRRGASAWRFEQQLWSHVEVGGKRLEVRPDGLALIDGGRSLALEIDLGHASPSRFRAKLVALDRFVASGEAAARWGASGLRLLTLTTGSLRARHLLALTPSGCSFAHDCVPFADFNVPVPGSWS